MTSADRIRRRYRAQILTVGAAVTVITVGVTVAWRASAPQTANGTIAAFAMLFLVGLIAYGRARTAVEALTPGQDGHRETSTVFEHIGITRRHRFPRGWAWAVAAAPIVTAAVGAGRYGHLPARLATGWSAAGHADHFAPTSLDTVDGFVTLQAIAALTILVVAEHGWSKLNARQPSIHTAAGDSRWVRRLLVAGVGVQLMLCTGSLILWGILSPTVGTTAVITVIVVAVPILLRVGRAPARGGAPPPPHVSRHVVRTPLPATGDYPGPLRDKSLADEATPDSDRGDPHPFGNAWYEYI